MMMRMRMMTKDFWCVMSWGFEWGERYCFSLLFLFVCLFVCFLWKANISMLVYAAISSALIFFFFFFFSNFSVILDHIQHPFLSHSLYFPFSLSTSLFFPQKTLYIFSLSRKKFNLFFSPFLFYSIPQSTSLPFSLSAHQFSIW